jgi:hypothetical protein
MSVLAFDAQAHVGRMVELLLTILQPLFWLALCLGFVVAGAHFLTMFVTRWGERRVSAKALFFSLAVHLSMGCGLVALIPEYRQRLFRFVDSDESVRVEIQNLLFDAETTSTTHAGNTPVWQQLTRTTVRELTRFDQTIMPLQPPEGPTPRAEPVVLEERHLPDVPLVPEQPVPLPEQQQASESGLEQQAVLPISPESPPPLARADVTMPMAARTRAEIPTENLVQESIAREPQFGSVDRLRPDYVPDPDPQSIVAQQLETARLERMEASDEIHRREGPAPDQLLPDAVGRSPEPQARGDLTPTGSPIVGRSRPRSSTPADEVLPDHAEFLPPRASRPSEERPLAALQGAASGELHSHELPSLERQNFDAATESDRTRVPATYQLRTAEQRQLATQQFGGTVQSEQAVERALAWLARTQQSEGFWDASRFGAGTAPEQSEVHERPNAGATADTGVTALAVLAFLGAGHTPERGQYAPVVTRALRWLVSQQISNGYLGGSASYIEGMYCHGMSTFALAEAYAMWEDPQGRAWLRDPIQRGVDFIVSQQIRDGSWRYIGRKNDYGDMSMFGWQLMALESAELGGIAIPVPTRQGMVRFLQNMSRGESGGLAAYRTTDPVTPTMTAEAMFCKQMLGLPRSHPSNTEAAQYLMQHRPSRTQLNYYYWYYGTLAMFQFGGEPWERWNEQLRDLVISEQLTQGEFAGSWEPRGEWGPYGGRVYTTAMAALCLEVYYRYLPLYRSSPLDTSATGRQSPTEPTRASAR